MKTATTLKIKAKKKKKNYDLSKVQVKNNKVADWATNIYKKMRNEK